MLPPRIRPATPADLPSISAIYNEAVANTTASYDYDPEPLERRIAWFEEHEQLGLPVLVAEAEDAAISGWSSLSPYHRRPGFRFTVENSVYVHALQRGRGIGGQLLAPLITQASALGLHSIIAAIDASNPASLRLHQRCGFREVGRFPEVGYKFSRWLDVIYLQRLL
jgi:phosphinothricin acetyltransferase